MRLISSCSAESPSGCLADVDTDGVAARVFEDGRIDQPVDDQHVRRLQVLLRLQRDEVGLAGPAADQRHAAYGRLVASAGGKLMLELAVGGFGVTVQDGLAPAPLQQRFPGAAAHDRVGDGLLHAAAQRLRALRDLPEGGRQPALDLGLDLPRQDGRGALRADGDDDRVAIDDRRHDEVALRGPVDDVGRQAAGTTGTGYASVEVRIIRGSEDQRRPVEVAFAEGAPLDGEARDPGVGNILGDLRRDDLQACAGLGEQAHLLQRLLAAADDEHVAALEIEEDRKVPQRFTFRCLRAEDDDLIGLNRPTAAALARVGRSPVL